MWLICLWIHNRCTYDDIQFVLMMIYNSLSPNLHYNYDSITCCFADLCRLFRGPICQPWRMGSDLGLHGFLRGLPGTDPRKCCVCWRLWIQGVDLF